MMEKCTLNSQYASGIPTHSVILGLDPRMTECEVSLQGQTQPHSPTLDGYHPHQHHTRMGGYTYIITNHKRGTLYIGVTADIERRIYEHREGLTPGFAWKYGCTRLVWYEDHATSFQPYNGKNR